MKPLEKLIVSSMYVASISNREPIEIIKEKGGITQEVIDSKIDECIKNDLIKEDRKTLTEFGRSSLKVVLAGGVFDIIHPGHIHTLKAAKDLGDVLIVVIATDNTAEKMKKRKPLHDQDQRKLLVDSLSVVDLSVVGHEGDIFKTVDIIKPQIIALGYDQVHQEKFITEGCKKINLDVQVARLQSPIPEVSSSIIEKKYGENIHDI
ncbi:MAG: adenylyltransferase/cytidyltransferase family protein [Nitrososphaeria archaeon]|nr:adenylyltransferase/cytidyltransferase family protein [Nitrosopumilaceae archaeon]NIP09663.1 adenylyltransferase/cytidyltransferase family protein [Nitrosopumilaceae archaeon]NIP91210.1 adenylyltransferase/cytidyltransferase family protein [Nitrososphaeria archaeon]NIS95722.1 adenylyltransferase/cytidyltransferase family protein [Nitrosopumilaceae archaeon]